MRTAFVTPLRVAMGELGGCNASRSGVVVESGGNEYGAELPSFQEAFGVNLLNAVSAFVSLCLVSEERTNRLGIFQGRVGLAQRTDASVRLAEQLPLR